MPGRVQHEVEGSIGWIVFDHPERRNALSANMWRELALAAQALAADESVRVVVMRGAGDEAFISGADISQFQISGDATTGGAAEGGETPARTDGAVSEQPAGAERADDGINAFHALTSLDRPLIAMIHGYCYGGGVAISLTADMRYAADDGRFAIPAARLGVGYDMSGVEALAELVGISAAKEILFTARSYDAQEALRMGLVNRVVAKAELESFVRDVAQRIAGNAPLTVRSVKLIAGELQKDRSKRDSRRVSEAVRACFESRDFEEGVSAFLEKRPPKFSGR